MREAFSKVHSDKFPATSYIFITLFFSDVPVVTNIPLPSEDYAILFLFESTKFVVGFVDGFHVELNAQLLNIKYFPV